MRFTSLAVFFIFISIFISCNVDSDKSDKKVPDSNSLSTLKGKISDDAVFADVIFTDLKIDSGTYIFEGNIAFSKNVDKKSVENSVKVIYSGKNIDFIISGEDESSLFGIKVKNIERSSMPSELSVSVSGKGSLSSASDELKITVPAKNSFEILKYFLVADKINILFSDKLDELQNIDGLVRITDSSFKYSVEGNLLVLYPENKDADLYEVTLSAGIRNENSAVLGRSSILKINNGLGKPSVDFAGNGIIIPSADNAKIAIKAVNINRIQITAFSVYEDRIGQFFQNNNFDGESDITAVGRYLWRKTVKLSGGDKNSQRFYEIDLKELFEKYPERIIRLTLSFNRGDTSLACSNTDNPVKEMPLENRNDQYDYEDWWKWNKHYGSVDDWEKRNDPCSDSYYIPGRNDGVYVSRNMLLSSVGIMASMGDDNKITVVTSDIRKASSLKCDISVYNFQGGIVGEGKSDNDGLASIDISGTPFYIKAVCGKDVGYLKVSSNSAVPSSTFDVGGVTVNNGINGFIYGERDIWRPGDDIYLVFILSDTRKILPEDYPMFLRFYDPKGQLIKKVKYSSKAGNFYRFDLKTSENDMTGNWRAEIDAGGSVFYKTVSIESIIPNRLFINLKLPLLYKDKLPADAEISSKWLNGSSASGLKSEISAVMSEGDTHFKGYDEYTFSDLLRKGNVPSKELVFRGNLGDDGSAVFPILFNSNASPSGFVNVRFESRVYEKSGNFSNSFTSAVWYPYSSFIGFNVASSDSKFTVYYTGKNNTVSIAALNADGEKILNGNAEIVLYKLSWKYWWDRSDEAVTDFKADYTAGKVKTVNIPVRNGTGSWMFNIPDKEWGRYLLRVCFKESGHCSSKYIFVDNPYWEGRSSGEPGEGISRLELSSEKKVYHPGETATVYIPFSGEGNAIVTVTSAGSEILKKRVKTTKESSKIEFPVTKNMVPGVYIHVALIQPWENKNNDMPLRLYGIIPVTVEDDTLSLSPVIKVDKTVRTGKEFAFEISEENRKEATYTVAVVDEGLLGITNSHVKNPESEFYRKKALITKFWDMYDFVAGKWSGKIESLISIGGDSGEIQIDSSSNERRYPPVVKFYGPYLLKKGEKALHKITIDNYNGSVRFMTVMGSENAFGAAEKTVTVSEPLEIIPSLPPSAANNETVTIPVSLFVNKEGIRNVSLSLKAKGAEIKGSSLHKTVFGKTGEKILYFNIVPEDVKNVELVFKAVSGNDKTEKSVILPLRNLNSAISHFNRSVVKPGKSFSGKIDLKGITSTRKAIVEISSLPVIDFKERLDNLIVYPHGCVEQTVSSAFPQLYLPLVSDIEEKAKKEIDKNIAKAVERLKRFQIPSGGFSYWPGDSAASLWATSYAGEFLIEASSAGYSVPENMITAWKEFQKERAGSWREEYASSFDQAYRLYTLALAGSPEISAMNRLKEKRLSSAAKHLLASAYALSGRITVGKNLIKEAVYISKYRETDGTFGSDIRDLALILRTETLFKENEKAFKTAVDIASKLSSGTYYSTQTTAVTLNAYAKFAEVHGISNEIGAEIEIGNSKQTISSKKAFIKEVSMADEKNGNFNITNTTDNDFYVSIVTKNIPLPGEEISVENGIKLETKNLDSGNKEADLSNLKLTEDLSFIYNISNKTGRDQHNLVLEWRSASGFRILNQRMMDISVDGADYIDYRDTSVFIYFSLKTGETKQFTIFASPSWPGRYYLPVTTVASMYDESVYSSIKGSWILIK